MEKPEPIDFTQEGKHTRFFDCFIECNGKHYMCHRTRLCEIEYFDHCLDDRMKVKEIDGKPIINLDALVPHFDTGVTAPKYGSIVNILINSIYGHKISYESISDSDLEKLKQLADYLLYTDLNYDMLDITLRKLIKIFEEYPKKNQDFVKTESLVNEGELIEKASQYLHNIDNKTLLDYFNQQYNGIYHHKLSSYQYLLLCVIFHRKLHGKLLEHIRTEKITDTDIKKLISFDRYNSVAYYFNSLKMKKQFDGVNKVMAQDDYDYADVTEYLSKIILTFMSDYKHDY